MESEKRVMIADSNPQFRAYLATELENYSNVKVVDTAEDGYDTVNKVLAANPDVLLMDVVLPRLDGLSVLRTLKNMSLQQYPVIIIMSSFITDLLETHAAALGATYFIAKPFEMTNLVNLLCYDTPDGHKEREGKPGNKKIMQITELLREIGLPSHIKGFYYTREAIGLVMESPDMTVQITKTVYPSIAESFSTTPARVERAIRHAIEVAWDRGDIDTKQALFGNTVSGERGKPTNSEFITMLADLLRIQSMAAMKNPTLRS